MKNKTLVVISLMIQCLPMLLQCGLYSCFAIWNVILLLFLFDCAVTVSAVEGRKARKPDRWRGVVVVAGDPTCFYCF